MDDIDLSRLLLDAHRVLAAELATALAERGYPDLRPGHVALVAHIDRRTGSRLTELAEAAGISKQGMMLIADELEARGYTRRAKDPADARAKRVRLTEKGKRMATEARRAVQQVESRAKRRLGERRYEALRGALEALAE